MVNTKSGGHGVSTVKFTFIEDSRTVATDKKRNSKDGKQLSKNPITLEERDRKQKLSVGKESGMRNLLFSRTKRERFSPLASTSSESDLDYFESKKTLSTLSDESMFNSLSEGDLAVASTDDLDKNEIRNEKRKTWQFFRTHKRAHSDMPSTATSILNDDVTKPTDDSVKNNDIVDERKLEKPVQEKIKKNFFFRQFSTGSLSSTTPNVNESKPGARSTSFSLSGMPNTQTFKNSTISKKKPSSIQHVSCQTDEGKLYINYTHL